jgi:hypothetical protein
MRKFLLLLAGVILGAATGTAVNHLLSTPARADTDYSMSAPAGKFITRSAVIGNVFFTVRIDSTSGDSWYASNGKWVKYTDAAAPGSGSYDIQLLPMPDGKSYNLVRTDMVSGRGWYIVGTTWTAIGEQ